MIQSLTDIARNKFFVPVALAFSIMASPMAANAGDKVSSLGAVSAADDYAKQEDAIGVVVAYGPFEGAIPPEKLGQYYVQQLKERGEKAKYFITDLKDEERGYSVYFDLGEVGTPAMSPNEANSKLDEIVDEKRRFRGHLGGEKVSLVLEN